MTENQRGLNYENCWSKVDGPEFLLAGTASRQDVNGGGHSTADEPEKFHLSQSVSRS